MHETSLIKRRMLPIRLLYYFNMYRKSIKCVGFNVIRIIKSFLSFSPVFFLKQLFYTWKESIYMINILHLWSVFPSRIHIAESPFLSTYFLFGSIFSLSRDGWMLDDGENIDDYSEEYDQFAQYRIQVNRYKRITL